MKRYVLFILILFASGVSANGQDTYRHFTIPINKLKKLIERREYLEVIHITDSLLARPDPQIMGYESGLIWYYRGTALHTGQRPAEAVAALRKAIQIFNQFPSNNTERSVADVYTVLAPAFAKIGLPDSCRIYHERAIEIFSRLDGADSPACALLYNTFSGYYIGRDSFNKAIQLRLRAFNISERHHLTLRSFITASNLSAVYNWGGERGNAILYMRKAMRLIHSPDIPRFYKASVRADYASLLMTNGWPDSAMYQLQLAREDLRGLKDTTGIVNVLENTARIYGIGGKYKDALEVHRSMETIYSGRPAPYGSYYANLFVVIARDFHMLGELDSSITYWNKALVYQDTALGPFSRALADTYCEKARTLMAKKAFAEASFCLGKSLFANGYRWNQVASLSSFESGRAAFAELARCYQMEGRIQEALACIRQADTCIMTLRLLMRTNEAKTGLSSISNNVYWMGAEIAWQCFSLSGDRQYLNDAFHFSEQSKSILLGEAIRATDNGFQGNVNKPLQVTEDSLREEVAQSRSEWQKALTNKTKDIREKEEMYFVQMRKYTAVLDSLKMVSPNYFDYRFGHKSIPTDSLSEWCNQYGQAVVSYFQTPQQIFLFLFQPYRSPEMISVANSFGIDSLVQEVITGITMYFRDSLRRDRVFTESLNRYAPAASMLFKQIFQPVKERLIGNKLVVIPYGNLSYLPFDALLMENPKDNQDYLSYKYLAEEVDIRYGFSATILYNLSKTKISSVPALPFISFAPFAYPDKQKNKMKGGPTQPLPASGIEVQAAAAHYAGKVFLREKASIDSFSFYAPMAGALHVSTHGVPAENQFEESCLWFAGRNGPGTFEKATISDICKLKLKASRVVISACDSGVGPFSPGEGVLSVARAFAYTGVPEIVMTVLPVDDQASCDLMKVFYNHLGENKSTGTSLWLAKKTSFEPLTGLKRLPYFWAGFMLSGSIEEAHPKK